MSRPTPTTTPLAGWLLLVSFLVFSGCSAAGSAVKRGDQSFKMGNAYVAATEYLSALQMKPKYTKAITKLSTCARPAYDQKLQLAEGFKDQGNLESALAEYRMLDKFVASLRTYNVLNFVPINTEEAIRTVSAGAAEKHYVEAEAKFGAGEYRTAIESYEKALGLTSPYKDASEKIAESYYVLAAAAERSGRYRNAAEHYLKAVEAARRSYKDSPQRATMIYYQLGDYFLNQKLCRNAYEDFERTRRVMPQYQELVEKMGKAKECATTNIAFVTFENTTGRNLAGMDLGDFIFEAIRTKTQARSSQFIRLLDREQLFVLLQEQEISASSLRDEAPLPGNLRGVDHLIFGKINQVLSTRGGLTKATVQSSYDFPYDENYVDDKGKSRTRTKWAKADMYYSRFQDGISVKLAGAIRVVEAQTGTVLINHQIAEDRSDQITYADEPRLSRGHNINVVSLPREFVDLTKARRQLADDDALAKQMIDGISNEMSAKILAALDNTPRASDPTSLPLDTPAR